MTSDDDEAGVSRPKILECMIWAGTGVLWTIAAGVPRSMSIIGEATAAEPSGLTFLRIAGRRERDRKFVFRIEGIRT